MSTTPSIIDFAKARPLTAPTSAPPATGGGGPVAVDFSKATPIDFSKATPITPPTAGTGTQLGGYDDAQWRAELLKNQRGEGTYLMKGPGGTVAVPHSSVVDAASRGYEFANEQDRGKYIDNAKAAGERPDNGGFFSHMSSRLAANFQNAMEMVANPQKVLEGTDVGEQMYGVDPKARWANAAGDVLSLLQGSGEAKAAGITGKGLSTAGKVFEMLEQHPRLQAVILRGLEANPRLARAGVSAAESATTLAAQDLATGRGGRQAATDAAVGAPLGFVAPTISEGLSAALRSTARGARARLERWAPQTIDIGTEKGVPVAERQLGPEGEILPGVGTEGDRATAIAQQQRFDSHMQSMSRQAVANSLGDLDKAIGGASPQRLGLPAPGGERVPVAPGVTMPPEQPTGQFAPGYGTNDVMNVGAGHGPASSVAGAPFTFTLGAVPGEVSEAGTRYPATGPVTESTEGDLLQSPRKKQIGTRVVERVEGPAPMPQTVDYAAARRPEAQGANVRDINPATGEGPALAEGQPVSTNARRLAKEPEYQYLTGEKPGSPAPRRDVVSGPAARETANPAEAVQWRNQLRSMLDSPDFNKLPEDVQQYIRENHDSLTDQLGMYYASPHGGIVPANVVALQDHVVSPGDAAEQLKSVVAPGFAELDRVTKGEASQITSAIQDAKRVRYGANATAAERQEAQAAIDKGEEDLQNLIGRHAGDTPITQAYFKALQHTYAHAAFLDKLDGVIEQWSNGISRENTANSPNLMRVTRGDTRSLEDFLAKGNNRAMLGQLMGPEAETTLKTWSQLLANPGMQRKTSDVLNNTLYALKQAKGQIWLAGMALSPLMGHRGYQMAAAGLAGTMGVRWLLKTAAVNPAATKLIDYAVQKEIDPKIYAPLIARAIASTMNPPEEAQPAPEKKPE